MSKIIFFKFLNNIPRDTLIYTSYLIISMVFWCIRHRYIKSGVLLFTLCFIIRSCLKINDHNNHNNYNDNFNKAYLIGLCLLLMIYYENGSAVTKPWIVVYITSMLFFYRRNNLINYLLHAGLFYLIYKLGYFKELSTF